MSLQEIEDYPVPAKENAILFLWATVPLLPVGLEVMASWNFIYKSNCVWNKVSLGLGNYFRINHEILLLGTRGKIKCPEPANRFPSIINEKRTQHSRKPVQIYEIIERMYPNTSKIELFARTHRFGWDALGHELAGK